MSKKSAILIIGSVIIVALAGGAIFHFKDAIITTFAQKLFLRAGRPLKFGSYTVLIDRIEGNKLYGIKVSDGNRRFQAKSGDYIYLPEKQALKFNLIDGVADDYDPKSSGDFHTLTFKQSYITIKLKSFTER